MQGFGQHDQSAFHIGGAGAVQAVSADFALVKRAVGRKDGIAVAGKQNLQRGVGAGAEDLHRCTGGFEQAAVVGNLAEGRQLTVFHRIG